MAAAPFPSFVASSKGLLQEEGGLPKARTSDGFDPDAYKLMKGSSITSASQNFWGVSLKQDLMILITSRR